MESEMAIIATRQKPEPCDQRQITHWTKSKLQLFRAYAEYLEETDDLDYVLMAMVDAITDDDEKFRTWHAAHPKAGIVEAKPKRSAKSKKTADRVAA